MNKGVKSGRITSNVCQPIENIQHKTDILNQAKRSTLSLLVSALIYNLKVAVHIM